jgi:hypothetical protein
LALQPPRCEFPHESTAISGSTRASSRAIASSASTLQSAFSRFQNDDRRPFDPGCCSSGWQILVSAVGGDRRTLTDQTQITRRSWSGCGRPQTLAFRSHAVRWAVRGWSTGSPPRILRRQRIDSTDGGCLR